VRDFLNRELPAEKGSRSDEKSSADTVHDEKRMHPRMACSKIVSYSVSVFYDWQLRSNLTAEIINMSEGGVGFVTSYPVTIGNVIKFTEGFPHKKGSVKWSTEAPRYRAGIKFI
jgi:hypothetical protein